MVKTAAWSGVSGTRRDGLFRVFEGITQQHYLDKDFLCALIVVGKAETPLSFLMLPPDHAVYHLCSIDRGSGTKS